VGAWIIPVQLKPVECHIHADRRLAFQVLTAFGAKQEDGGASRVLADEGHRKLVEFLTPIPSAQHGSTTYRTVEWVTPREPEEIRFDGIEGPLALLRDRFVLLDEDGCTRLRYESTIGLRGSVVGWLVVRRRVRPTLEHFMRHHAQRLKATIEARARKSRVYPLRPCRNENV
jgi:hypothetical protein